MGVQFPQLPPTRVCSPTAEATVSEAVKCVFKSRHTHQWKCGIASAYTGLKILGGRCNPFRFHQAFVVKQTTRRSAKPLCVGAAPTECSNNLCRIGLTNRASVYGTDEAGLTPACDTTLKNPIALWVYGWGKFLNVKAKLLVLNASID